VRLAAKDAHYLGMVEAFPDSALALETVIENRIGFEVGVGNFEGDNAVVAQVGGAIYRGHTAASDRGIDAIGIELGTGFKRVVKAHCVSLLHSGVFVHFIGKW
jgi:hypothetical protein